MRRALPHLDSSLGVKVTDLPVKVHAAVMLCMKTMPGKEKTAAKPDKGKNQGKKTSGEAASSIRQGLTAAAKSTSTLCCGCHGCSPTFKHTEERIAVPPRPAEAGAGL